MTTEKQSEKGMSNIVGVFTDPIISYPSPWNQDIPKWVKDRIILERLMMNMKAIKGEEMTGTDAEALAYLMPASLETPMDRDWADIYLYVSTKVCDESGMEVPKDIRVEELSDYLMHKLNHLKAWIYQKRINARLDRDRDDRRQKKEEAVTQREKTQPALFTF